MAAVHSESMESKEEFHFFSGKESPLHPQHKAEFQVDGVKYNFVEQYVLRKKAEMCNSTKDIAELMKIADPNHFKQFDKKYTVTGAVPWETKHAEFMKRGYVEKSKQVKTLFDLLQDTKVKHLVYATRKDSDLGIGVDANDPLSRRKSNWKGKNLLGEWLMEVRAQLPNELECSFDDVVSRQEATGGSPRYKGSDKEKDPSGPEKFTFFWRKGSPFSQWHPCSFAIDDQWYNCAEQYMMHQKAVKFGDHESAQLILKTKDPLEQKKLGRGVAGFDDKIWSPVSMDIVKKGNLAKFGQNEKLKGILFETVGTTLVEASPADSIWGIGLDAKDPRAKDRKQWHGKNQLGQVLTEVREELLRQEREKDPSKDGGRSLGAKEKDDGGKPPKRKADDISPGQVRKTVEGVADAKVPKGHDPTALRKERDQRKGDPQSGKIKKGQTQNSSQRKDKKVQEESNVVEMRPEEENLPDQMSKVEDQGHLHTGLNDETKEIVESRSLLPKSCNEAPLPAGRMEYSDVNLDGGKEKAEEVGDSAWDGFNAMELDIDEDSKEKKKREGSKDDYPRRSDRERTLKKGKTGENYRREHEKIDDQALPEKFTFFWRADSPFSQHHPANFSIDGVQYNCAEQFMMHQKTVVFHDERIGREIMHSSNPAKQKSLAKQIEGFDDAHWKTLRRDVVKQGNIAKFSQNPRLRRMLFATAGTTMVEASPMDNTWGIGLSADDPKAWLRRTWSGGNMLGDILTEVREELMDKFKNNREDEEDSQGYKDFSQGGYSGERYTVFWRPVSPFHPRYPAAFELDNEHYQSLQQYIFHQKALFSNDSSTARAIMENYRPNKLDELGRKIRNCDDPAWSRLCRSYLRRGNFAKFSQNRNIGQQLIDNVLNGELVYAVEDDHLLGVGLKEEDGRLYQKKFWKGKNLLGRALMEVRDMLIKHEQTLPETVEDLEDEVLSDSSQEAPERQFQFFFIKSPFNQWQLCRFRIGNFNYNSAEQYMLHQMALHFHDQQAADAVMRCCHPRDMQDIHIRDYDDRSWEAVCKEIILEGNRAKFTQNHKLREDLCRTEDSFLAYASVKDVFLGTGMRDTDPLAYDQRNWPGYNVLGDVLMEVREELRQTRNNSNNNSNRMWKSGSTESISYPKNSQPVEKFTFFWQRSPFSQWWKCSIEIDGHVYNCAEQYMMHQKALYFGDLKTAQEIMKIDKPSDQCKLGRRVQGYANDKWNAACQDVVRRGNMAKFSQHPNMRQKLFATAGTTLVEASPNDCKWGIGVTEDDPRARRRETWLGENLLGQILTEVRDELMKQDTDSAQTYSASNIPPDSGSGRDRRGSERSDHSQGHRKDSESNSRGLMHESHQKSRFDRGGGAEKPSQHPTDRRNQWSHQNPRPERDDTAGRPHQHRHEGSEWSEQNSRSVHGERPHVAESRCHRDGDRQRQHMDSSSDQYRNMEKQQQVEELTSHGSSRKPVSEQSHSTSSGQSHRPGNRVERSVPAERSKAPLAQHGATQSSPGDDGSKAVVDGAVSNENIHIISEKAALSLWHQADFEVDKFKYTSIGQYIAHQKALRFNDGISAEEIMKTQSIGRIIKCDKYVDGFDKEKWNSIYRDVTKDGCYHKFTQNEELKQELLATAGSLLVYADVKDPKFDVGLKSDDRDIRDQKRWRGKNALGFVLMEVREDLIHGRDSSNKSRDQACLDVENHNVVTEITGESKSKDVQEQILDSNVKAVTSEDSISLDTGNLGATDSSCNQKKGELEQAVPAELKEDNVSKVQKPESLQEIANFEKESFQEIANPEKESLGDKESLKDTAVPKKDIHQETAVPKKESVKDTALRKKESRQKKAVPEKESIKETAISEKESLQQALVPKAIFEESIPKPVFSTDSQPGSKDPNKVVELSDVLEVKHKVEAAEINSEPDKETKLSNETVQTTDNPQSFHADDPNNKNTTASETSASSENDEIVMAVPHSEVVQTVAQSHSSSETTHAVKKELKEADLEVKDGVLAVIPGLGFDSESHQKASDATETPVTSQNQAFDEQKHKDTHTAGPQDPATNKRLENQKDEIIAESGVGKQSRTDKSSTDSADGKSHKEDTVSTVPDGKGLLAKALTTGTCGVLSAKEIMAMLAEENNTKETSDSTKEALVDDIHPEETISTTSKTKPVQVQSDTQDTVQQASTTPDDESTCSTESQPEEAISAGSTEKTSLNEDLDENGSAGGSREAASSVEKETLEAQTENASQDTAMTTVNKNTSSAKIIKEGGVLIAEREVLGAQSKHEDEIEVNITKEKLEDKNGSESHQECISTNVKTEMLKTEISSANTHPVDVESTGKSEIKLEADPIAEKPHDKGSNECKQEENCSTLQESKPDREGLGDKSNAGHNQMQAISADIVKEVFEETASTENSCQEIKPVIDKLDDKREEKLEDKSSVESTPEEANAPVAEVLEVKASSTTTETKLVKDELNDEIEAQLGDKSSVEGIPEEASVPAAVEEALHIPTIREKTNQEELVGKVEGVIDDRSSTEGYQAEAKSMAAEKEVLAPIADAERTRPVTSTKEELDRTNSTKAEASQQTTAVSQQATAVSQHTTAVSQQMTAVSQQATDMVGTKSADLQTGERTAENEENNDPKTSHVDGNDKIQTETNHSHEVSSHS